MKADRALDAVEQVRNFFRITDVPLVLVYGSAAKGAFGPESDVDIAIASAARLETDFILETKSALSIVLGREVDLVDLNAVDGLLLYRIMTEGKRVKTDRRLFLKFQGKALTLREDFLPLLRLMRMARIGRFIDGSGSGRR